jgi:hypothetical protein
MNSELEARNTENDTFSSDEILVAFAEALEVSATPAVVRDWMGRYPAQAKAIARYAADRLRPATGFGQAFGDGAVANSPVSAARLRQIAGEVVAARRAASAVHGVSPLRSLLDAAKERGLAAEAAAARLDVPFGVFVKLHRRLVAPESVPAAFVRRLAETVGRTADEITAYLRQPPTLAAGASYRADAAPTVGAQESFADALRSDPEATSAQTERWLG